jgi:hypothetical protein
VFAIADHERNCSTGAQFSNLMKPAEISLSTILSLIQSSLARPMYSHLTRKAPYSRRWTKSVLIPHALGRIQHQSNAKPASKPARRLQLQAATSQPRDTMIHRILGLRGRWGCMEDRLCKSILPAFLHCLPYSLCVLASIVLVEIRGLHIRRGGSIWIVQERLNTSQDRGNIIRR